MFKAVEKPKEYTVIKVPSDCKDVGKFVHEEFESNGTQIKVITQYDPKVATRVGKNQNRVNPGDVIVDDYSFLNGHMLHVMSQEDFEKKFKPVDNSNKLGDMSSSADIDTNTAQRTLQAIKAKMSTAVSIEKQPHVRIEFDDVNDVPHVWIDGKQVDSPPNTALVSVDLNWHTRDQVLDNGNQNQYKIEYLDGDKRVGIAQGNVFSNELFKQ